MISEFQGNYRWLSNFWRCKIEIDGIVFESAEHAYQAHKPLSNRDMLWVAAAQSSGAAKRRGARVIIRPDWNNVKVDIMRKVVTAKFRQNKYLMKLLLETGNQQLVEGNTWGDRFWGKCDGVGQNWLGRILMDVRSEAKKVSA